MSSAWVDLQEVGKGQWKMRQTSGVEPYETTDPDTKRVWWSDAGVHQNLTFPVHPDPITGMHCWHQMVRVERAGADDRYGDIFRRYQSLFRGLSAVEGADASRAGAGRTAAAAVDPARASARGSGVLHLPSSLRIEKPPEERLNLRRFDVVK
jgi:hypothetical protein